MRHRGFTLIELLLVLTLLIILAQLVAVDRDAHRVRNAAQALQMAISDARNRAMRNESLGGFRVMLHPTNYGLGTGLVYLQSKYPGKYEPAPRSWSGAIDWSQVQDAREPVPFNLPPGVVIDLTWSSGDVRQNIAITPDGVMHKSWIHDGTMYLMLRDLRDIVDGVDPSNVHRGVKHRETLIVAINPRTGACQVHPVDRKDADGFGTADDLYRIAAAAMGER